MLDVTVSRVYRETLSTNEDKEVSATNLTDQVKQIIKKSGITDGFVHLFSVGSTGAIVSIEFEEGLLQDLKDTLRRLFPRDLNYHHGRAWRDDNAHSHLRSTVLGPQMMVPVTDGEMELGSQQQIAVVNLDSRPRERSVIVTVFGR